MASLDKDKKQISQSVFWYNSLHLLLKEEKFVLGSGGTFVPAYMTL
jgi:hypothetical protein